MSALGFSEGAVRGSQDQGSRAHPNGGRDDIQGYVRKSRIDYTEAALRDFEREIEELALRRGYGPSRSQSTAGRSIGGAEYAKKNENSVSGVAYAGGSATAEENYPQKEIDDKEQPGRRLEKDDVDRRNSFNLHEYFRTLQEEKARSGIIGKHVGVLFENLSVVRETHVDPIIPNSAMSVVNLVNPVAIVKFFLGSLFRRIFPSREDTYVLKNLTGLVKDGEMCLLLGRAGSGCTTFLRTIGLIHSDFKRVEGRLELAGIGMKDFGERFRGEVLYNPDKDGHIAVLTVRQTLDFALRFKTPGRRVIGLAKYEFRERVLKLLLSMFKIQKIENFTVGNAFHRGISGGERRRLTIAEMLAAGNAFSCWDNLTNGLDSSTAFEVVRALRVLTDVTGTSAIVSLCQASEKIYSLFDKVMILDHGVMLYFGPVSQACGYFESLGYVRSPTQSSPDFLMDLVDVNTRKFSPKFDIKSIPTDHLALQNSFLKSHQFEVLKSEMDEYHSLAASTSRKDEFIRAVLDSKSRYASKRSTFTVSYAKQVLILALRNLAVNRQNRLDNIIGIGTLIICSLIIGIGFFQMDVNARGLFTRGSLLFLSVIFNALQHYSDLMEIYQNRFLVERHKNYRFYCASAEKLAYLLSNIPKIIIRATIYTIIIYPMTGLKFGNFLALLSFYLIMILSSMCALSIFMAISSLCKNFIVASRVASVVVFLIILLSGFVVPQRFVPASVKWLYAINPVRCAFENYMIMEFRYLSGFKCSGDDYVPSGPTYTDDRYKFCSLPGSSPGDEGINGLEYIKRIYGIVESSYWPNIGIILFSILVYLSITCVFTELLSFSGASASLVLYKKPSTKEKELDSKLKDKRDRVVRELLESQGLLQPTNEEGLHAFDGHFPHSEHSEYSESVRYTDRKTCTNVADTGVCIDDNQTWNKALSLNTNGINDVQGSIMWRNVYYTVNVAGHDLVITNNVSGFSKPGQLTALMGSSGAGKTTFLDVMCSRKTTGTIAGQIMLGGEPITPRDHGKYAYCEQSDILNTTSTVREALRFSANLRQSFDTPQFVKNMHVEELLSLLELEPLANAVIGDSTVESGLDLGKRKLVSIGVELSSKPSMMVVLDEPTTGLDTKSAGEIIRFLKKLAKTGLIVICTIHQPNTTIFEQFDNVLLLVPGGKTAYFGPIGDNSSIVLDYFQKRGAVYDPQVMSPPEFILDVVVSDTNIEGGRLDWAKEWDESEENRQVMEYLDKCLGAIPTESIVYHNSLHRKIPTSQSDNKVSVSLQGSVDKNTSNLPSYSKIPTPWMKQLKIVTKREFTSLWRMPDYTTTRVFSHVVTSVITSLSFSNADNTLSGIQSRMFSLFQLVAFVPMIVPAAQLRYFRSRMLYSREEMSGTYCRSVFALSILLSEIPLSIFCATLFGLIFYLPSGFKKDAAHLSFFLFAVNLTEFFAVTLGMAIASLTPSIYLASKFIPCIFLLLNLYSGVSAPYSTLPAFVRYTIYWIDPFRWLMGSLMESEFSNITITCNDAEYAVFDPPPGSTCGEYMAPYLEVVKAGYLNNPNDTRNCKFCSMSSGDEFLSAWGGTMSESYMVRDIFLFFSFTILNAGIIILATKFLRFIKR